MFKKLRENPYYLKFKELYKNPKTRSLISLFLWFIFFLLVILFLRGMNSNNVTTTKETTTVSYEFTYENDYSKVFGECFNNRYLIFKDNRYYYNGNFYLIDGDKATLSDFNMTFITPSMIDNLISGISLDGDKYIIPLDRFISLYDVDTVFDLSSAMQYNVIMYVTSSGYAFDLSNYYLFKGLSYQGILKVSFYNKNELSDFSLEYERMIEG